MELNEYQKACMRTAGKFSRVEDALMNAALGLGEVGEVQNLIKKHVYHGHELDRDRVIDELGDAMYYVAWMSEILGMSLAGVAIKNIEKLQKRYPEGFSYEASINRTE